MQYSGNALTGSRQYGNLQLSSRIVEVADTYIVAQGVVWDLEANVRISTETRRITTEEGRRYNEDMIMMTGNAAASIALRNAILLYTRKTTKPDINVDVG